MRILPTAGLSLALALACHAAPEPAAGPLFDAAGHAPYYRGKSGFPDVVHAKEHAFREFQREVRAGRIDPSHEEFFTFIYTLDRGEGHPPLFFHAPWAMAPYVQTAHGSRHHRVQSPLLERGGIRIYSMMHSHPTQGMDGAGPSRVDVATASKYRNADGSYRYLYLINNRGRLIQFKATRSIDPKDPAALRTMPVQPRRVADWLD